MAAGERDRQLGADARLAAGLCGARARAVPRDRRATAPRPCALRAHQVANTRQAGVDNETDPPGRAAARRRQADPGACGGPTSQTHTYRRQRTRDERSHRHCS